MSRPIFINLVGGPGAGKTTTAMLVTARLKACGVDAVYVPECALDKVLEGSLGVTPQFDLLAEQVKRLLRTYGSGYRVVVTDSPIILQAAYSDSPVDRCRSIEVAKALHDPEDFYYCVENFRADHSMVGREQDAETSKKLDVILKDLLNEAGFPYKTVPKLLAADEIVNEVTLALCLYDGQCVARD